MNENVPTRLKRLRESAGLSIRALAELLGRSGSGYAHYERPDRFKDPFLPMDLAQDLARALALAAGDVLIVDQKRLPDAGELALANARTDHGAVTVVGRWLPPILVTDETLAVGRVRRRPASLASPRAARDRILTDRPASRAWRSRTGSGRPSDRQARPRAAALLLARPAAVHRTA